MIKCFHLTPKSKYSNIGDLVADPSRWSSLVFLLLVLFLLECFFSKKKLHLDVSLLLFCVSLRLACFAVNSLQILVRIPLPSELSWKIIPLHQTRFHRIATTRWHRFCCSKEFSVKHFLSFSAPAPLNDSYPLLASGTTLWLDVFLKDQTHLTNNLEVPSWKLMSKGERGIHQSLPLQKRCTLQEERLLHVSKRGETS